jgi:hypothetical protein
MGCFLLKVPISYKRRWNKEEWLRLLLGEDLVKYGRKFGEFDSQMWKTNFLWHACHEILPTCVNLHRRKIVEDALCPLCGSEEESIIYVLWQCPAIADVWSVGCKKLQKWSSEGSTFLHLVEKVFSRCDPEETQLFMGIARRLWLRRNDFVFGKSFNTQLRW